MLSWARVNAAQWSALMGWHDSLAARATAMGKTAADFKGGAQRKANVTWLFLIVAGAVWYFVGWGWAVIPACIAAFSAMQSVRATMIAARLDKTASGGDLRQ